MLSIGTLTEAQRQFEICNACRYCEGVCAVFPALERRSVSDVADVVYLANLCHDCRACLYVCPFAPPHEFAVNVPRVMSEVREATYADYTWPRWMHTRLARSVGYTLGLAALASVVLAGAVATGGGVELLTQARTGRGAFYRVVPWLAMALPAMAVSLYALVAMGLGAIRFWRGTGSALSAKELTAPLSAMRDVITLRYLRGGGGECYYPDEEPSPLRWVMHSLLFYGFAAAFTSTVLAALYQDWLGRLPPFELTSLPVMFGIAGGLAMIIGAAGLLVLKARSDPVPASHGMATIDIAFLIVLLSVNVTGMLLLALRATSAMPLLLDLHLGLVAALLITLPYGKFAHAIYRYLALVRNRIESLL